MLVKCNLVPRGSGDVYCKYEMVNGNHYVYFESDGAVRKLQLPCYSIAQDLVRSLSGYKKLKVTL